METSVWEEGWQLWDLVAHLTKVGAFKSGHLFRGQPDAKWGLVPSLYRRELKFLSGAPQDQLYLTAEQQMLDAFFDQAAILLPNFPRGLLMDRIIAQHYGIPTQLLDWTLDPFIALYFATHGEDSEDCALFYISPMTKLNAGYSGVKLPWREIIYSVKPPIIDQRIKVQKSVFTIQKFGDGKTFTPLNDRVFASLNDGTDCIPEVESFGKIVIPAKRRRQILLQLLELGVDSALVYPGLQGIGQRITALADIKSYGTVFDYW